MLVRGSRTCWKLSRNICTSLPAVSANSALLRQVLNGSRMCGSTPGTSVGTARPKYGSVRKFASLQRAVERGGQQPARDADRHAAADADAPPVQPVLTSQQST